MTRSTKLCPRWFAAVLLASALAGADATAPVMAQDPARVDAVWQPVVEGETTLDLGTDEPIVSASFGTSDVDITTISWARFFPVRSSSGYDIGDSGTIARRATGPDTRLYAEIGSGEVPNGALITQIVFYVRDNHASDITAHLCVSDLESVFGTGYDASCSLIGGTSGTPGETHVVSNMAETVQRRYYNGTEFRVASYHLVFWPAEATDQLDIRMARVLWRRQISPAPGRATFGDVPTDHPFFQHVEALASSGITGGCGGGDYCPGAPVTRGQMAVFIATALGLHWPAAPAF